MVPAVSSFPRILLEGVKLEGIFLLVVLTVDVELSWAAESPTGQVLSYTGVVTRVLNPSPGIHRDTGQDTGTLVQDTGTGIQIRTVIDNKRIKRM